MPLVVDCKLSAVVVGSLYEVHDIPAFCGFSQLLAATSVAASATMNAFAKENFIVDVALQIFQERKLCEGNLRA